MTFSEFLEATGNQLLAEKISALEFTPPVVKAAKKLLANYYYVGGMPKAVKVFIEENSLVPVRGVQEQILQTYIADFPKYNSRMNIERIERVFYAVVTQLSKKIIYQKLDPGANSRDTKKVGAGLICQLIVQLVNHFIYQINKART